MNCWEILGLAPTQDTTQIRHAFAERAKQYHPEDDPDGYTALRAAYKQALFQAGQGHAALPPPSSTKINAAASGSAPSPPQAPPEPQNSPTRLDFDGLARQISMRNAQNQLQIDSLMGEVRRIYLMGLTTQNKPAAISASRAQWQRLVSRPGFVSMQRDAVFTQRFLEFAGHNPGLARSFGRELYTPFLQQWQYLWNGSPLWGHFAALLQQEAQPHRPRAGARGLITGIALFMLTLILVAVFSNRFSIGTPVLQAPATQPPAAYPPNNDLLTVAALAPFLPLEDSDYDLIEEEAALRGRLTQHLEAGDGWPLATEAATALGLDEKAYAKLAKQWQTNREKASATLESCRPTESAILRGKVHPILKSAMAAGTQSSQLTWLLFSIGMNSAEYERLQEGYAKNGEAWVDKELAPYDHLIFGPKAQ